MHFILFFASTQFLGIERVNYLLRVALNHLVQLCSSVSDALPRSGADDALRGLGQALWSHDVLETLGDDLVGVSIAGGASKNIFDVLPVLVSVPLLL